jgi:transposase
MAKPMLDDELWERIEPFLLPKPRRSRFPGRKPLDHRKALTGILFVFKMGIAWEDLPPELGCGCGMSCWRRLREWQQAGVWPILQQLLLAKLPDAHKIDWARADADRQDKRAVVGGQG